MSKLFLFSLLTFLTFSQAFAEALTYVRPSDSKVFYCLDHEGPRDPKCVSKLVSTLTPDFGSSQASNYAINACRNAIVGFSDCYVDAFDTFKPNYGSSQAIYMAKNACF